MYIILLGFPIALVIHYELFSLSLTRTSVYTNLYKIVSQGRVPKCGPDNEAEITRVSYTKCPYISYETIIGWGWFNKKL
jgi:hypothetical protein